MPKLTLRSWTYNNERIALEIDKESNEKLIGRSKFHFFENSEFKLISIDSQKTKATTHHHGAFDIIETNFKIQRNGGMIYTFVVAPSVFLSFIIYSSYTIVFGDNQRLIFGLQLFLSNVLFCFVITRMVPLHSNPMYIQKLLEYVLFTSLCLLLWNGMFNAIFKILKRYLNFHDVAIKKYEESQKNLKVKDEKEKNNELGEKVNLNSENKINKNSNLNSFISEDDYEKAVKKKKYFELFGSIMKKIDLFIYLALLIITFIHQFIYIGNLVIKF